MKEFGWAFLRNQSWFDRFLSALKLDFIRFYSIFLILFVFIQFYVIFLWFHSVLIWFDFIRFFFHTDFIRFSLPGVDFCFFRVETDSIYIFFQIKVDFIHFLLVSQFILDFISELNNNRCCLPHWKFTVYSHSHQHDWYLLMNNNKWIIFYTCD